MHSHQGALGETLLVYGEAIKHIFDQDWPRRFLVVGLGMGYIELAIVCYWIQFGGPAPQIESFESDLELKEGFQNRILGKGESQSDDFKKAHDLILEGFSKEFGSPKNLILEKAKDLLNQGHLVLRGPLDVAEISSPSFSALLFDAFSRNTTPELWSEEFLEKFLEKSAAPKSVFATYSAIGNLKRVLKKKKFERQERSGFGQKRERTLAVRNYLEPKPI